MIVFFLCRLGSRREIHRDDRAMFVSALRVAQEKAGMAPPMESFGAWIEWEERP